MKLIRENTPFIIGCFAYYVSSRILSTILWLGISFLTSRFPSQPSNSFYVLCWIAINAFARYSSFFASTSWIALPMLKRINKVAEKTKREFLFIEWFLFTLFVYLYGSLPISFLPMLPIAKEVQKAVAFIWMAIVSFALYKDIVSSYAFSSTEEKIVDTKDAQAKVV